MPFDPYLVHAEEPPLDDAGELLLPDDLVEFSAQLGDDARHLSACYPAKLPARLVDSGNVVATEAQGSLSSSLRQTDEGPHASRSPRRRMQVMLAVASVAGLLATASVWRWMPPSAVEPVERPVVAKAQGRQETTSPVNAVITPSPSSNETPSLPKVPALSPSPAFFLQEYSGPELEGIYDLLGESSEDSISI